LWNDWNPEAIVDYNLENDINQQLFTVAKLKKSLLTCMGLKQH
jgi:hypothetical protein